MKAFFSDLDDTLTYGFMHPDVQGQPMPGVLEVIAYLQSQETPIKVLTNQAGIFWEYYQDEIMHLHPEWQRRDYPNVAKLAEQLVRAMWALNLKDIYVAIWDERLLKLITPVVHKTPQNVYWHEEATTRFKDEVLAVATKLSLQLAQALEESGISARVGPHPAWRKPEPGMLLQAAADLGIEDYHSIVYCGDMHTGKQQSDYLLAKNAGVQFLAASDLGTLIGKSTIDVETSLDEIDDHPF